MPLEWLIAHVLTSLHALLVRCGMDDGPGSAWCLSLVGLVVVIRLCLLPLFLRQMRAMRRTQALQPELARIRRRYTGRSDPRSREAMQRETMALYQRQGVLPLAAFLPTLVQGPVLCALCGTLQSLPGIAAGGADALGGIDRVAAAAIEASHCGPARLSDVFLAPTGGLGAQAMALVAIAAMCATMMAQQWLLLHRNTPREAMVGPQFRMQRVTALTMPLIYIVSGVHLPFGVLLYWMTNNLCNFGQAMAQLRLFPAPGSLAGERKAARDHARENMRRVAAGMPSLEEEQAERASCAAQTRRARERRHRPASRRRTRR